MVAIALYARVSTKKQQKEKTIESQIAEIEQRIINDGHELLEVHRFIDNGVSGTSLERQGLDALRDQVEEGKINKIYIHSSDRLSRDNIHLAIVKTEFENEGVELIFLNFTIEDTPNSRLLFGLQGLMSQYERETILERNRRGKLHAARIGRISVMSNAPYGFYYVNKHVGDGNAKFEVDEEEADVVRKMFNWVGEERVSINEVARRLDNMSIMTRKGKSWRTSTVSGMLNNPAYIGQAAYGKTKTGKKLERRRKRKGSSIKNQNRLPRSRNDKENWIYISVPNIVNEDLFNVVQEQLVENKKRRRERQRSGIFLLQSLVSCQRCQYSYHGTYTLSKRERSKLNYYRCSGTDAYRFDGNKICDNKSVRADIFDTVIWEEVKILLEEPYRIENEYQRRFPEETKQLPDFKKEKNNLNQFIARSAEIYAKGYITYDAFELQVKAKRQRLQEIKEQEEKMTNPENLHQELSTAISSLEDYASTIESKLDQVDWQTRQNIVRKLVRYIEINYDNLYIVYRIKELANLDQNRHSKILSYCTGSSRVTDHL